MTQFTAEQRVEIERLWRVKEEAQARGDREGAQAARDELSHYVILIVSPPEGEA